MPYNLTSAKQAACLILKIRVVHAHSRRLDFIGQKNAFHQFVLVVTNTNMSDGDSINMLVSIRC